MRHATIALVFALAACGEASTEPSAYADVEGVWSQIGGACADNLAPACWPLGFEIAQDGSAVSGCGTADVVLGQARLAIDGRVTGEAITFTAIGAIPDDHAEYGWRFSGSVDGNLITGTSTTWVIQVADTAFAWEGEAVSFSQTGALPGPHCP